MLQARDYNGLLLYYSCINNKTKLLDLAENSENRGFYNVAYSSYFLLNNLEKCLEVLIKSKRFPEAALFCRTYHPLKLSFVLDLWNNENNTDDLNSRKGKYKFFIFFYI